MEEELRIWKWMRADNGWRDVFKEGTDGRDERLGGEARVAGSCSSHVATRHVIGGYCWVGCQ